MSQSHNYGSQTLNESVTLIAFCFFNSTSDCQVCLAEARAAFITLRLLNSLKLNLSLPKTLKSAGGSTKMILKVNTFIKL